ncbi:MAG: DUF6797 domain-containing protein [Opitutaceae bacterium]
MPHGASPSSFAIGLPGGVSFCFDPLRGAVSYAWTGGFVDVTPARPGPGKFVNAVELLGPIVYQESGAAPLRHGDPARVPDVRFAGYTLHREAVEFRYTVDGTLVREEIRARSDGAGLTLRLQVETTGPGTTWWRVLESQPPAKLTRDPSGAFVIDLPFDQAAP